MVTYCLTKDRETWLRSVFKLGKGQHKPGVCVDSSRLPR